MDKVRKVAGKKVTFVRYGGLSPVKQKGYGETRFHSPPARHGIYAFVDPFIEMFLLGGDYSKDKLIVSDIPVTNDDSFDWYGFSVLKENEEGELDTFRAYLPRPRRFVYTGFVWHHLPQVRATTILATHNAWIKTNYYDFCYCLKAEFAQLRGQAMERAGVANLPAARFASKDHLEVFIEKGA
jgi:hypothetical protein